MMASFLPGIVSKKNKQTEKYVFYCSVSLIHINPEKKHEKTHHNDCLNVPTQSQRQSQWVSDCLNVPTQRQSQWVSDCRSLSSLIPITAVSVTSHSTT